MAWPGIMYDDGVNIERRARTSSFGWLCMTQSIKLS